MQSLEIYRLLARYNRWMNEKIYAVCAELSDQTRKADRKAPFHSIHGTLNHLLLTDSMWLGRFRDQPFVATSLDQELFADFEELHAARRQTDAAIEAFVAGLDGAELSQTLRFTPMSSPQPMELPFWVALTHLFNHQTHHRGQLTTLLEQEGVDFGVTDLPRMPGLF